MPASPRVRGRPARPRLAEGPTPGRRPSGLLEPCKLTAKSHFLFLLTSPFLCLSAEMLLNLKIPPKFLRSSSPRKGSQGADRLWQAKGPGMPARGVGRVPAPGGWRTGDPGRNFHRRDGAGLLWPEAGWGRASLPDPLPPAPFGGSLDEAGAEWKLPSSARFPGHRGAPRQGT